MQKTVLFVAVFFLLLGSSTVAMERFDIVTTEDLVEMLEDRKAGKVDFLLVNTLDELIYRNSSIPGSINIPWCRIDTLGDRLGKDKDKLIVMY